MATQPNALSVSEQPQGLTIEDLQLLAAAQSTEIISAEELPNLTDKALVEYAAGRIVKFAMEMRPVLIEVHTRFFAEKKAGRSFLGYTDFEKFCLDVLRYTSRQIRNIINGTPTPAGRSGPGRKPSRKSNRQVVEEGTERQHAIEVQQARDKGFEEGRLAERKAQEILAKKSARPGATFDPNPGVQLPSSITAELTISWAGTIAKLKPLTKSLKSNLEPDALVKTEAQELVRALRTFSKDAADRAELLEGTLRTKVQ